MSRYLPTKPIDQWLVVPGLIGFVYYVSLTRFHGLNPFDVDWLLPFWRGSIDSAQHYLGWEFFRQAPLLQWPPGKSPNLGPTGGSGVALTDSLPLFALIFKPLTFWFDQPFQYFGIWVLTCFVLQAIFAWKLLTLWVKRWEHAALGTYFFCFAPIFIDRISVHLALAGQWVLLAALFVLFSPRTTYRHWLFLGFVAMLVQPYLAIICAACFFAWLLIAVIRNKSVVEFAKRLLAFVGVLFASGWISGLFIFGLGSAKAVGFGTYSANGLALVDPGYPWYERSLWSRRIPDQWQNSGQYEGMNFLGSGVLILAITVLLYQLLKGTRTSRFIQLLIVIGVVVVFGRSGTPQRELVFLLGVVCASVFGWVSKSYIRSKQSTIVYLLLFLSLSIIAVTNQMFIGDFLVFNFSLPESINGVLAIVRTSGRMLWPVTYLITALLVAFISINLRRHLATALLLGILVVQTSESVGGVGVTKSMFNRAGPTEYLSSPMWDTFGERYSKVAIVLPNDNPILYPTHPDFTPAEGSFLWREIGMFAVKHRMQLNSFYFSREPQDQNKVESKLVLDQISSGILDPDTLYVFIDADSWEKVSSEINSNGQVEVIDFVPVLAP